VYLLDWVIRPVEDDDILEDRSLKSLSFVKLPLLERARTRRADDSARRRRLCRPKLLSPIVDSGVRERPRLPVLADQSKDGIVEMQQVGVETDRTAAKRRGSF
jgi:hypothetical protein